MVALLALTVRLRLLLARSALIVRSNVTSVAVNVDPPANTTLSLNSSVVAVTELFSEVVPGVSVTKLKSFILAPMTPPIVVVPFAFIVSVRVLTVFPFTAPLRTTVEPRRVVLAVKVTASLYVCVVTLTVPLPSVVVPALSVVRLFKIAVPPKTPLNVVTPLALMVKVRSSMISPFTVVAKVTVDPETTVLAATVTGSLYV